MFSIMMAAMLTASTSPATLQEAPKYDGPTLQCREMGSALSRSQAVRICRTKAQWLEIESCRNVTRYCAPKKRVASLDGQTAFPLNEDSRIVCRILKGTGTRLMAQRTCLPQREWQRMWDDSRATMSTLQDRQSIPPTGPR